MQKDAKDFARAADAAVNKELQAGKWPIYLRYGFLADKEDFYVYAPWRWVDESDMEKFELYEQIKRSYEENSTHNPETASHLAALRAGIERENNPDLYPPLNVHGLFLEFAGLVEERPITKEVVLEWVNSYGVLGLDKDSGPGAGWGNPRGGLAENLTSFQMFAQEANMVLRLYEAATAPDGPDVESLQERMVGPQVAFVQDLTVRTEIEYRETEAGQKVAFFKDNLMSPEVRSIVGKAVTAARYTPAELKDLALETVRDIVNLRVTGECHPHLYGRQDGVSLRGWGFKSLLGAMHLQMLFLITSPEEDIRRCLWCNRVIAFRQPEHPKEYSGKKNDRSAGYRTRKDRVFCDNNGRCKGLYHYHNREKPERRRVRRRTGEADAS